MAGEEQNRSEAPTRFKLDHARKKGQVPRGLDLSFLAGLVALLGFGWIEAISLARKLARSMHDALVTGIQVADDRGSVLATASSLARSIERPLVTFSITTFVIVLLFELLQTGLLFSWEPLRLDLSRISPAQGLRKLFSFRLLVETGKNLLKLTIYTSAAAWVILGLLKADIGAVSDASSLAQTLARGAVRLLLLFAGSAFLFAVVDQLIARREFLKRMRMSRREIKQEFRDREGDPRLKQKRKRMHAEFIRNSRSLRALRSADMLIVNPDHIAIALRYDAKVMSAPTVVAIGADHFALRLRRLAPLYGVTVIEDRALARALFKGATPGRSISSSQYRPVADLYNRLRRGHERKS